MLLNTPNQKLEVPSFSLSSPHWPAEETRPEVPIGDYPTREASRLIHWMALGDSLPGFLLSGTGGPANGIASGLGFPQDCWALSAEASNYTILVYHFPKSRIRRISLLSRPLMKGSLFFFSWYHPWCFLLYSHSTAGPSACEFQPTLCPDSWWVHPKSLIIIGTHYEALLQIRLL